MEQLLALEMVRVTEAAALASARFMGRGDNTEADRAATEAMRRTMDEIEMSGTIVIGEGERDQAPIRMDAGNRRHWSNPRAGRNAADAAFAAQDRRAAAARKAGLTQ